jgi:hypothetical protein
VDELTGTALLRRLQEAGGLPAHAEVPEAKGRAEWAHGQLRYRLTLKQRPEGIARWALPVGDRQLGRSFHEGGILALVPIRPAPDAPAAQIPWPAADDEVPGFLRALHAGLVAAAQVVRTRRDLCEVLIAPGELRRGDLVVDLRVAYVERVLRALCVARAADDGEAAAVALAILHAPPADGPVDGPSSLLDQARIWADQWSYQSGLRIEVPDAVPERSLLASGHPGLDALPTFWERVG